MCLCLRDGDDAGRYMTASVGNIFIANSTNCYRVVTCGQGLPVCGVFGGNSTAIQRIQAQS
jgi:hypothetical protein